MKNRFSLLVGALVLVSILVSSCGTAAPQAPTAAPAPTKAATEAPAPQETEPAAPVNMDPVYIGALLPQSEPGAPQAGTLILRGIELGAEYVNKELGGSVDGRPVEIVVGDDKGTPEVGATEYRRLVQEYNIIGATGQYHSSVSLAVIEVAKELGAPVIMTQASNKAITESGYPQVFRTHLIDPVRALALVDFAKSQGYSKIGYIADNTDFGTSSF